MKPETFLELMNELPGDMVVSAVNARYRRSPAVWIPAVAACLAATIAATAYPRLRVQEPEIAETTVLTAGTGGTYPTTPVRETQEITTDIPPATTTAQTTSIAESRTTSTATAGTTTASRETETVSQSTAEPPLTTEQTRQPDTTEPPPETTASATREQPETTGKATTGTSATTTALATTRTSETTRKSDTTELQPETTSRIVTTASATTGSEEIATQETTTLITISQPDFVTVPLWSAPPSYLVPREQPFITVSYIRFPENPTPAMREKYGIPADYELTDSHRAVWIQVNTSYKDVTVTGGTLTADGLTLNFAYLDTGEPQEHSLEKMFVIPGDNYCCIQPERCTTEYIPVADEAEFYALQSDTVTINLQL